MVSKGVSAMSQPVKNSMSDAPIQGELDRHDHSEFFFEFADYAAQRYPLHPKVTAGERRALFHNHILDVGDLARAIATRRAPTAKFGTGKPEDLFARVTLPDHRFDAAEHPAEIPSFWLDSPIIVVDLDTNVTKRSRFDCFVPHEDPHFDGYYQLNPYNIDLTNAVVVDGYQRLRQAIKMLTEEGRPARINYISISMREALLFVCTMSSADRSKQEPEQIRSLFIKDGRSIPAKSLHPYIPAARRHAQKGPGLRSDHRNRERLAIGAITAQTEMGRPKADAVLSALFLHWQLEFRRAVVFRDLLKREWTQSDKPPLPSAALDLIDLQPHNSCTTLLYDRMTDPVLDPIGKAETLDPRWKQKDILKNNVKEDRRQYRDKIGTMGVDAFLDRITSKTYTDGGFENAQEFNKICTTLFEHSMAEGGIGGAAALLEQSIQTGISLFRVYFRIIRLCYPAVRTIAAMKQSEDAFSLVNSKATKDYVLAFSGPMTGAVGKHTHIHVKEIFAHSATIGHNLCDFYPEYSVVADIVEALVDVIAQSRDESGTASETHRAQASAFAFANYAASHRMGRPDRWKAWSDFSVQAQLNGVTFDEAVYFYSSIYESFTPLEATKNGFRIRPDDAVGYII